MYSLQKDVSQRLKYPQLMMHVFLANVTDAQRPDIAETVGQVRTYIMQMVARVPSDAAALSDLMPTYGSDGGIVPNSSAAAMQT